MRALFLHVPSSAFVSTPSAHRSPVFNSARCRHELHCADLGRVLDQPRRRDHFGFSPRWSAGEPARVATTSPTPCLAPRARSANELEGLSGTLSVLPKHAGLMRNRSSGCTASDASSFGCTLRNTRFGTQVMAARAVPPGARISSVRRRPRNALRVACPSRRAVQGSYANTAPVLQSTIGWNTTDTCPSVIALATVRVPLSLDVPKLGENTRPVPLGKI